MILSAVSQTLKESREGASRKLLSLNPREMVATSSSAKEVNLFLYHQQATLKEKREMLHSCVENHIKWLLPSSDDFEFLPSLIKSKDLTMELLKDNHNLKLFIGDESETQIESLIRFEEALEDLKSKDLLLVFSSGVNFRLPFDKIQSSKGTKAMVFIHESAFLFTNAIFAEKIMSSFDIVAIKESGLARSANPSQGEEVSITLANEKGSRFLSRFKSYNTDEELTELYGKGIEVCHSIVEMSQDSVEIIYETSRLVRLILSESELNVYPLLPTASPVLKASKKETPVNQRFASLVNSRIGVLFNSNEIKIDLTELAFLKSSAQNATMVASVLNLLFAEDTKENLKLLEDILTLLETTLKEDSKGNGLS